MGSGSTGSENWANLGYGAHDPAVSLLIDTQAELRADVRVARDAMDMLGGDALEVEAPVDFCDGALDAVFARIDALEIAELAQPVAAKAATEALTEVLRLPEPVVEYAVEAISAEGWKNSAPGIKSLKLNVPSEANVELLRIEPGFGAPQHDHSGVEHTLVLTGAFRDESGLYGPGDLSTRNAGDVHRPVAEPGEICYALAVTEGQIQLTGALGLIQKLFTRH